MKQCSNGHFFDEQRFASCPYCGDGVNQVNLGAQNIGKTVAINSAQADIGKTVAVNMPGQQDIGKTVAVMKKNLGFDPVVGFLVCVKGAHKGEDFRLIAGRNFVGRSKDMDVALINDETISRENHAIISYDSKKNSFMVSPGTGRGITYHNNAQIESAAALSAYDQIEIGECTLLFIPVCSERFNWEEE